MTNSKKDSPTPAVNIEEHPPAFDDHVYEAPPPFIAIEGSTSNTTNDSSYPIDSPIPNVNPKTAHVTLPMCRSSSNRSTTSSSSNVFVNCTRLLKRKE